MRLYFYKLLILLTFFNSACVYQKAQSIIKQPLEEWRKDLPNIENTPQKPNFPIIKEEKLENGLKIILVEDHKLPILEVRLVFKTGTSVDTKDKQGLISLTTKMLKEGSGDFTGLKMAEKFADMGTEVNVSSGKDSSNISVSIMSDHLNDTLKLLSLMVKSPLFKEDDFLRIKRKQEAQLLQENSNPSYLATKAFLKNAYGENHPYGFYAEGLINTLSNIDIKDVKKAYEENFGLNNAALIVAGDVTLAELKDLAKNHFGFIKKFTAIQKQVADPLVKSSFESVLIDRKNSSQSFIMLGKPALKKGDESQGALEVLQRILAGNPTSRLGMKLREEKGWTYGVNAQNTQLKAPGPFIVTSSVQVPFGVDALNEILLQIKSLQEELVSDDELLNVKNGLLLSYASNYASLAQVVNSVSSKFIYNLPSNIDEKIYDNIKNVSKQDIMNTAKKYLKQEQMTFVAVGDLDTLLNPLKALNLGKINIQKEEVAP